jgi:hypothetical protein
MSEPIKPNPTAVFYNTTIPALTDDANIQQALRMYHYGTPDGSIPDEAGNPIRSESVAAYLRNLQTQITDFGIGSEYTSAEPVEPEDGFIWVDSDSAAPIFGTPPATVPSVARYQNSAPTTGLVDGMLWVDKDASPIRIHVYDAGTSAWRIIG